MGEERLPSYLLPKYRYYNICFTCLMHDDFIDDGLRLDWTCLFLVPSYSEAADKNSSDAISVSIFVHNCAPMHFSFELLSRDLRHNVYTHGITGLPGPCSTRQPLRSVIAASFDDCSTVTILQSSGECDGNGYTVCVYTLSFAVIVPAYDVPLISMTRCP